MKFTSLCVHALRARPPGPAPRGRVPHRGRDRRRGGAVRGLPR